MNERLSDAGKDELAIALLLWKDFKCQGRFDTDVTLQMLLMADHLGIRPNVESMMAKLPVMRIEARDG